MTTTSTKRRIASATIAASIFGLATAGAADAAVIHYDRGSNSYTVIDTAPGGEQNDLSVRVAGGKVVLTDATTPITSATGRCVIVSGAAQCPTDGLVNFVLGAGRDTLDHRIPQGGTADLGDDVDALFGSHRPFGPASAPLQVRGGGGFDYAGFTEAPAGVNISDNDDQQDGVVGQNFHVSEFEGYYGSPHADRIFASPGADVILAGLGDDTIATGVGDDVIVSNERDGADDVHGGPGSDWIHYYGRTQGITLASNELADDGEPFERDFIRSNVENVVATDHDDRIFGSGAANRFQGSGGNDRLEGAGGSDTLTGGAGIDTLLGDNGQDAIDSRDGERDIVSCGVDHDFVTRDAVETKVSGCENDQVGKLSLDHDKVSAQAGKPTELGLSWTHPKAWKQLRSVVVRVTDRGAVVGTLTIDPAKGSVDARGAVELKKGATKLVTKGKAVSLDAQVRFSDDLVGRELSIEVEATDQRGVRQPAVGAAKLEVR